MAGKQDVHHVTHWPGAGGFAVSASKCLVEDPGISAVDAPYSRARAPERFQKWHGSGQNRGPKGRCGMEFWVGGSQPKLNLVHITNLASGDTILVTFLKTY